MIEGEIVINNDNITVTENILVPEVASQSIFNNNFLHNGLWHFSIEHQSK